MHYTSEDMVKLSEELNKVIPDDYKDGTWGVVSAEIKGETGDYKLFVEFKKYVEMVYFISGHLDLTGEEFNTFYKPQLDFALEKGACFVVGDAHGADKMAQDYLKERTKRVIVYHMLETPRNNAGFPLVGGFASDEERDAALTAESDKDIAWVREGRESSRTAENIIRRWG